MDEQDGVEEVNLRGFFLCWLLIACATPSVVFDNAEKFNVEIAKTIEQKEQGLMYRTSLAEDQGMLFVFDDVVSRSFWMKNTLISLDMIFLGENQTVVEIKENVPPCKTDPCGIYTSVPAKSVLEIGGGLARKKQVHVGSIASLRE